MRETAGSMRAYMIVVGLLGCIISFFSVLALVALLARVSAPHTSPAPSTFEIIVLAMVVLVDLGLSIAFLYTGITLPRLLKESPHFILRLLFVLAAWAVLLFLLSLTGGIQAWNVARLVGGLLVTWYLYRNTLRLSSEARAR